MAVEQIKETDTLNQGRVKINDILIQSNASSEKVDNYKTELTEGIKDAKKIAKDAGDDAIAIATEAGNQANETANQALNNSKTAITTADQAVSTANNNKQEFDTLRNDFDQLVSESGDSNPEIVQARTDTQGIKQATLANRLQIDFADRMTKAEGISLLVGGSNIKIMMDFVGKTAGNTATNPNKYFSDFTAKTLKKPTDTWNEVSQADYNKLASRDDSGVSTGSTQSGVIPQQRGEFNIVEIVKALIPQIFEDLDKQQSVTFIKNNFVSFTLNERLKATSPNNKNIKVSTYLQSSDSWSTQIQETAVEFKDFSVQINDKNFITNEGFIHLINYTDPSNGVTSSNLEADYAGIQIELSVNAQDILRKSGFVKNEQLEEHTNNKKNPHSVTKEQVGLGDVSNYKVASESEAILGVSATKYMTPKNVNDAMKTNAVMLEGGQDINGVKNFSTYPQINTSDIVAQVDLPFGVALAGGGLDKVKITDGTILKWGTVYAYDNQRSRENNLFDLSTDNKTLTIKKDCCLHFSGRFACQTANGLYYAYLGMRVNGANDRRIASIAGSLNWRNDVGWNDTREFKTGDKVTVVLGTNYTVDKSNFWGVDYVHISEAIKA